MLATIRGPQLRVEPRSGSGISREVAAAKWPQPGSAVAGPGSEPDRSGPEWVPWKVNHFGARGGRVACKSTIIKRLLAAADDSRQ